LTGFEKKKKVRRKKERKKSSFLLHFFLFLDAFSDAALLFGLLPQVRTHFSPTEPNILLSSTTLSCKRKQKENLKRKERERERREV